MADLSIFDLTGKKALVTGAAGGIGKACALGMAKAGADVAVIDLKEEMGKETVEEIKALGRKSLFISCDVTDTNQVAGDLVAQELPDLPFDAAPITGLNATRGLCSLRFDAWRRGKPKMEFFFGDRIR